TINLSSAPQLMIVFLSPRSLTQITRLGFTKTSCPFTSSNSTNSMLPPLIIAACSGRTTLWGEGTNARSINVPVIPNPPDPVRTICRGSIGSLQNAKLLGACLADEAADSNEQHSASALPEEQCKATAFRKFDPK